MACQKARKGQSEETKRLKQSKPQLKYEIDIGIIRQEM